MAVTKQNALPLLSVLTALGTAFSLWFGVFDRGAQSGTVYEKVATLEKSVASISQTLNGHLVHSNEVIGDFIRVQEQLEIVREQIKDIQNELKDVQRERIR